MKFSTVFFVAGLIASVAATPSDSSSTPYPTSTPSAAIQCLEKCDAKDVKCRAACFGDPAPSSDEVNNTNKCVAACDKGDGSAEATNKYKVCVDGCIKQHYLPNSSAVPSGTAGSGSGNTVSGTATGTGTGKATGTSNPSSTSGTQTGAGSAIGLNVGTSIAGLVAILVAAIAL